MTAAVIRGGRIAARRVAAVWRPIARRPIAAVSLAYLVLVLVAAVTAPALAPYGPTETDLERVLSGPTADHPFGTDNLGRDLLSRLMYGGRVSLPAVAEAVLTFLVLGVTGGVVAGFLGGWWDRVLGWVVDVMLAIPAIVMLLVVLAVFVRSETAAMVAFGVLGSPALARVARGATLAVRGELYVAAARVSGLPDRHIIVRHVLPRVAGPIIVQASLFAGAALLAETGLGYLGLGPEPPAPTWGGMVADAAAVIDRRPWLLVPPGLVIGLAILAFGLLGDAVRDATAQAADGPRTPPRPKRPLRRDPVMPPGDAPPAALLSLRGITIALPGTREMTTVVQDVSMDIGRGETVGLVGESGCGKSLTGRAVLGLLPSGGVVRTGSVLFDGADMTGAGPAALRRLRGREIALISQDPIAGLDPVHPAGRQVAELVRRHHGGSRRSVRARTLDLLQSVNLPDPEAVARRYPHELSGGMAQRVAIAMALAGEPRLLIADEPTTALDVTVQAEILGLLRRLQRERGMSILLITHDWGVVAAMCRRAYVMYAGQVVEECPVTQMVDRPLHPYTAGLLGCMPSRGTPRRRLAAIPGTVPAPGAWPDGCRFAPRCGLATAECGEAAIPLLEPSGGHHTRCVHHTAVERGGRHGHAPA
ncbi:dipeptide/oligopeptide/nickel ABC transporter permease/ATP-binding protein [Actinomadura sp. SCN-SB]|uniref:dipeptide/oligopeptide/nickel ABC transporter permease/ATP-binding protein n=1 Tax=Actinomadura sp. SCN-SB TaxID=3373092 RepID=UPI0037535F2D